MTSPLRLDDPELERAKARICATLAATCPAWLADQREDLAQAALVRLLSLRKRREGSTTFSTAYVKKVAYTVMVDEIRRQRRASSTEGEGEAVEPRHAPDQRAEAHEIVDGIQACLTAMAASRRPAVIAWLHGHSVPEIAQMLDVPAKKAENLVYRGLADLRACLANKGIRP